MEIIIMKNIRELYNNFIVKLQEITYTIGATKRIQIMSECIDIRPGYIILDIGGNTGKITEAYSKNCKEVVVLEPLPDGYFDEVVASASFHHFSDQDISLEEMRRVLKPD